LCQGESSACMPCGYHSLSSSCSQVLIALITSSPLRLHTTWTAFLGLQRGGNLKGLGRDCKVDRVTLFNQTFLLWLSDSSNMRGLHRKSLHLCTYMVGTSKMYHLTSYVSCLVTDRGKKYRSLFSGQPS
jgi:hypothetical protein